jgi:hypothetical protein
MQVSLDIVPAEAFREETDGARCHALPAERLAASHTNAAGMFDAKFPLRRSCITNVTHTDRGPRRMSDDAPNAVLAEDSAPLSANSGTRHGAYPIENMQRPRSKSDLGILLRVFLQV